jgi:RNA polymerase sigma factor (sigma-70 family)
MQLEPTTKSLLVAAKLGSEEAINKLFAQHQARILRIVRLRLSPTLRPKLQLQSMDIVQEVFIHALQNLKDFEPQSQGHFFNWLSKKVEWYIKDRLDYVNRLKRKAPEGEISTGQDDIIKIKKHGQDMPVHVKDAIEDNGPTPSQYAVKKDREELIDSLLDLLEPEDKEIIINRNLEELSFAEMGKIQNKSEDAARKQYSRAFKRLLDLSEDQIKLILAEETYRQYNEF